MSHFALGCSRKSFEAPRLTIILYTLKYLINLGDYPFKPPKVVLLSPPLPTYSGTKSRPTFEGYRRFCVSRHNTSSQYWAPSNCVLKIIEQLFKVLNETGTCDDEFLKIGMVLIFVIFHFIIQFFNC
jgi:hypothetical protein